jgi:hypothetical protein
MALHYNGTTIGTILVEQEFGDIKKKFKLQIRQGNCLAVIIYVRKATPEELAKHPEGKYYHQLHTFFLDEKHMKNIIKDYGTLLDPMDKVLKCEFNMYYKENYKLLKYFVLSGYKVTCYYKEPKKK